MLTTRYDSIRATSSETQRSAIACRTIGLSHSAAPVPASCSLFANRVRSSSVRCDCAVPVSDDRSKSSVVVAMYQPRFSSPSRPDFGMRTLSKKTSLKPSPFAMLISGRTLTPGVFMSMRK